jgi:hypothetical protein
MDRGGNLTLASRRLAFLLIAPAILFGFVTPPSRAQQHLHSTPEERTRALKTARSLQSDPLSPDVRTDREWLIEWLTEVPDISVSLCPAVLGDLGNKKNGYPGALIAAEMASEAAFVIEHPDKSKDRASIYLAGADGALNAYQAIRAKDAKYRVKQLDEMIQKRDQGKLGGYISDATRNCKN